MDRTTQKPTMPRSREPMSREPGAQDLVERHGALEVVQAVADIARQEALDYEEMAGSVMAERAEEAHAYRHFARSLELAIQTAEAEGLELGRH